MSRLTKADKQALAQAASETNKIVSLADEKIKKDSFDTMWAFMMMGAQKSNVPFLIESETLHDAEDRRSARVREGWRRTVRDQP